MTDYSENLTATMILGEGDIIKQVTSHLDDTLKLSDEVVRKVTAQLTDFLILTEKYKQLLPLKLTDTITMEDSFVLTLEQLLYLIGFLSALEILKGEID